MKIFILSFLLALCGLVAQAGQQQVPACLNHGAPLPIDNQQVITWKKTTANQFTDRGHVSGSITKIYQDHSGHHHFEAKIGPNEDDTVEIIYNESFGPLPSNMDVGSQIEACGVYITSNAPADPYPASPDGALIHWVHRAPRANGHDSGYLVIDGVVCGWDN